MTAIDERTAETATGIPRCSVMVLVADLLDLPAPLVPYGLVKCGLPAVGYWQGSGPCGHVRDGWRCRLHDPDSGEGGCLACIESADDPHDCPLPLARVTPGGAS